MGHGGTWDGMMGHNHPAARSSIFACEKYKGQGEGTGWVAANERTNERNAHANADAAADATIGRQAACPPPQMDIFRTNGVKQQLPLALPRGASDLAVRTPQVRTHLTCRTFPVSSERGASSYPN